MGRRIGRGVLWVLSVLMVSAGGGLIHAAFAGDQAPFVTFFGLTVMLTGAAIYVHALRYPSW